MAFGLIYWGVSVLICAPIGSLFISYMQVHGWMGLRRAVGLSLIFGLLISGVVFALSSIMLRPLGVFPGAWQILFYSFTSAAFILFFMMLIMHRVGVFTKPVGEQEEKDKDKASDRPKLLDRVPELEHATEVWALSAQDHYVRVLTDKGAALALIRLSDAIAECMDGSGVQTHRSHWVAQVAVDKSRDMGVATGITLLNGETVPVSKSRLKEVRAVFNF